MQTIWKFNKQCRSKAAALSLWMQHVLFIDECSTAVILLTFESLALWSKWEYTQLTQEIWFSITQQCWPYRIYRGCSPSSFSLRWNKCTSLFSYEIIFIELHGQPSMEDVMVQLHCDLNILELYDMHIHIQSSPLVGPKLVISAVNSMWNDCLVC